MIQTKKLAADLSEKITYTPADDMILVKPLKPVMITKEVPVLDNEPKDMDEAERTEPKFEKKKVPANMQKGIVLKLGIEFEARNPNNLEIGDVVAFPSHAGQRFELFKDTIILRRYEVVAYERGV